MGFIEETIEAKATLYTLPKRSQCLFIVKHIKVFVWSLVGPI